MSDQAAAPLRPGDGLGGIIKLPPPAVLAILYAVLITVGAVALKLPAATAAPISWSDALFTATSAVTVTGLVVVDTGSVFTMFGQGVILLLIQFGGIGLMSFAVFFMLALGLEVPLPQRFYLQHDLGQTPLSQIFSLVSLLFRVMAALTLLGVFLLSFTFVPEFGWVMGLWQSLFHAISAVNNAGFSLFPDSLSAYVDDPVTNLVITGLFIAGGLGFVVFYDIWQKKRWRAFSLHTKLMLIGTPLLIAISVPIIAVLEAQNPATLGAFSQMDDRFWAAWFQATTPRTAGFNTIDTGAMSDGSTLFIMALMIIGGGPGSTAGGLKVTTFFVAGLATLAFFRRQTEMHAFNYAVTLEQVLKVMALITISSALLAISLFVLVLLEDLPLLDLSFEAASAFGTVGLSRGITADLSEPGRFLICLLMFAGRVGPLTFGFFLATKAAPRIRYPEGTIYLG